MRPNDPLERSIRELARRRLPVPPPASDFSVGVWAEIRRRRRQSSWSQVFPLLEWRELFREPRLAVAALACAFVVGVLPAAAWNRVQQQQRLAQQSLHLDVFSSTPTERLAALFSPPAGLTRP